MIGADVLVLRERRRHYGVQVKARISGERQVIFAGLAHATVLRVAAPSRHTSYSGHESVGSGAARSVGFSRSGVMLIIYNGRMQCTRALSTRQI